MNPHPQVQLDAPASYATRREARITAVLFVLSGVYVLFYAVRFAYDNSQPLILIMGIPSWVLWGVLVPWMAITLFTVWFAIRFMRDEDMGQERTTSEDELAGE